LWYIIVHWLAVTQTINNVYILKSNSTPCPLANNRSCESFEGAEYFHLQSRAVQSSDGNFTLQLKARTAFENSKTICQSIRCKVTEVMTIQHGCANVKTLIFRRVRKITAPYLSWRMVQIGSQWTDFDESWYLSI
jgi:hypothetical protein